LTVDAGARDRYTMYIWAFEIVAVSVGAFVATVSDINLKMVNSLVEIVR
jgi:hypothetical protein